MGVRSKCQLDAIHFYEHKSLVSDWVFSADPNLIGMGGSTGLPDDGNPGGFKTTGKGGVSSAPPGPKK